MKILLLYAVAFLQLSSPSAQAKDSRGAALYWEVVFGTPQSVRAMLDSGRAVATDRDNTGTSSLHAVCNREKGHTADSIAIAEILIKCGVNVNDTGRHGQSILWNCAAGNAPKELIQYLVAKGGNLNLKTRGWQTPCDVIWTDRQNLARYFKCPRTRFVRELNEVGTTTIIEGGSGCRNYHPMLHPYCD